MHYVDKDPGDRQTVTLNIGLEGNLAFAGASAAAIADSLASVLHEYADSFLRDNTVVGVSIVRPSAGGQVTEPTVVASYSAEGVYQDRLSAVVYSLARTLGQQAIAVQVTPDDGDELSYGFLAGPGAELWGEFNQTLFDIGPLNAGAWTYSDLPEAA